MTRIKLSKLNLLFIVIATSAFILLPTNPVNAGCNIFAGVSGCILEGTSYLVFLAFTIVGSGIAALAGILQWTINIPVYPVGGIAVISKSWEIMRNFANMFFILALIMMAFATIFDVLPGAAKYNARALFGRFLLTALLINFSLVLGVLVIQGTQVLSNTFLTAIGDMSGRLGQGLNPSLLLKVDAATAAKAVDQGIFGALVSLVFALVLAFTFFFSLLTAVIFAIIRIPILWALLVVSPIAWILNIFPAGQGTFKRWWSLFVGWNMFLPIFLFFLYFGLYFLQSQGDVMKAIAESSSTGSILGDVFTSFTFQMLFMYLMAGIFLIGGTIVAMKASMFSGTGVVGIAKWSRGVVANRLGLTAAGRAATGRYEEYKEGREGAVQRQAALFRTGLGRVTGGRTDAQDRQLAADVQKNKDKFASNTDAQLTAQMSKGRKDEKLAAAEILNQRGLLSSAQLQQTYALYGANTLAGKQFARSLNYDKMSAEEREDWLGRVPDVETIKKILQAMADKGDSYIKDEGNLNRALDLFKLEGDQKELLKKIEKHEFEIATKLSIGKGFIKERVGNEMKDIREVYKDPAEALLKAMEQTVSRMNPDALLEATRTLTSNPKLSSVAKNSLNQQKILAMMAKGTEAQLDAWKKIDNRFDADKIKAETETKAKELAEITGRSSGEAIARELNRGGGRGSGSGTTPGTMPPTETRRPAGFVRPDETIQKGNVVDLRNK